MLVTGMGFESAASAIEWVLMTHECDLVIVAGFAGALDPELRVGDVVVASEVVETDGETWRTVLPAELGDRGCGRILTSRNLIGSARDKLAARKKSRAVAVDMESAAITEACQGARVPCAVIRVISDSADTGLSPHLAALLSDGTISPGRVLAAWLRRPLMAAEFWRLARATSLAAKNLADALDALIA